MRQLLVASRFAGLLAIVALITALYVLVLHVNPTTVALTYLIAILLIATTWGLVEATTASVAAVLCFNFFFLPPVGTLTIADPQNWVAFVAFLATAIVASQLSGRARQREIDAAVRQRDLERLYALSRALLLSDGGAATAVDIARRLADAFELKAAGVYDQRTDSVAWGGAEDHHNLNDRLRNVARRGSALREDGLDIMAIQLGGAPIGAVAVSGSSLSDTVLQSMANLVAIGLERSRAADATARAEAARKSSELRATVLDAVAHEFKTPLTAMKAASSDLLSTGAVSGRSHELASIIDEEADRLGALVTDAVLMLRIDAGDFKVRPERIELGPVVEAALKRFERALEGHVLVRRIPTDMCIQADQDLLSLALRQLLDNAIKYSPETSTIEVVARGNGGVEVSVGNTGSTIAERDRARLFERYFRGADARQVPGTGMGLAIVSQIARAHAGSVRVESAAATGTTFTLTFPGVGASV